MRLLHTLPLFFLLPFTGFSNTITESDRQDFIDEYALIAVEQMKRNSIPASIILAQAIIESNWGTSDVARNAKNFFCIKCNNGWTGPSHKAKDDEPGLSCFRKYDSVWDSFQDHSNFLTENIRYRPLFEHQLTDYRSWAKGLKACGYATDERYAEKLIGVIENYGLDMYDVAMPIGHFPLLEAPEAPQAVWETTAPDSEQVNSVAEPALSNTQPAHQRSLMDAPFYRVDDSHPRRLQEEQAPVETATLFQSIEKPTPGGSTIRPIYLLPDHGLQRR
jgi:hypothetical protein